MSFDSTQSLSDTHKPRYKRPSLLWLLGYSTFIFSTFPRTTGRLSVTVTGARDALTTRTSQSPLAKLTEMPHTKIGAENDRINLTFFTKNDFLKNYNTEK